MSTAPAPFSREPRPRLEGKQLGRYQVLAHIASGGMAGVYAARQEGTFGFERIVALKVLHPHLASEDEFLTMFVDEARLAARIRHPRIVSVLDIAEDPGEGLYLVMDYVEGDHLGNLSRAAQLAGARLPTRVVLRIVLDLLEGLEAAHGLVDESGAPTPIVHRDCTPHNVLVGVDGAARLTDFGVARAEARLTQTETGKYKGKLGYMAPEQLRGQGSDARADLFAAAVVLYESLTGRRLFRGDSPADTLRMLLVDPIPDVASLHPDLEPLSAFLGKALSRAPEDRFESASAMAEALWAIAPKLGGVATPREVGELV
ncbi:MAG: serine/threonine protein kinase, partial [Polyangiaceae bacterium]|nr:serine/threonine protein kinase [Polyangiaceae bacterium]